MTDQISFLPMLDEMDKPEPLHVKVKRMAEAILCELWDKHKGNVREYVAECVDRFAKEKLPWYDLREDDRVQYDDVVGECFSCGKPITARDICNVDAINYTWVRKDGKKINAYVHYNGVCTIKSVMDYEEFHKVYLRFTGYTDEEYIRKIMRDNPSVFYARVKAGMYDEEGNRLHPEGWLCQPKMKKRKAKGVA